MSITSLLFLFLYLPLSLAIYYLSDDKVKEYVLLALSLLYYSIGSVEYIVLFLVEIFFTVFIGRRIYSSHSGIIRKILLFIGICCNVSLLFYYKYYNVSLTVWGQIINKEIKIQDVLLPLGISFYSFKAISYLIDVYKGKALLSENSVHDALYLSFFAQIQSGPITRYGNMYRIGGNELFAEGAYRFLVGFNKKVLLANVLSNISTEVFGTTISNASTDYLWLGSICYSLQLYYDFSGYSDMAIGISKMFGYDCMENFNYPYMTESVSKFWRRWHISLSEWFRDYIYIPLGGARTKYRWQVYFNLFVVWALTGIWHGANWNFLAWGLGYFILISFEKATNIPERFKTIWGKALYRGFSLLFVNFQWVLFNSKTINDGIRFIKYMIIHKANALSSKRTIFLIKDYWLFLIMAIMFCFPVAQFIECKISDRKNLVFIFELVRILFVLGAFIWAISFVVAGRNNPFAYANF